MNSRDFLVLFESKKSTDFKIFAFFNNCNFSLLLLNKVNLQIAWPCLAVGGIVSHMVNMPLCRSIPHLSMTLMSIAAGCFGAGGSVPYVMKIIVDNTELELFQIFMIWTIIYIIVSLPKVKVKLNMIT